MEGNQREGPQKSNGGILEMTYEELQRSDLVLFHGIRGSQLYGLQTPTSDTDTYQVFCAPPGWILGTDLRYRGCISDEKNDNSSSELKKYIKELGKSNPDALISLWTPPELILKKSPLLQPLFDIRESLLTKECFRSFRGYAKSQIGKAKGLEKSMNIDPSTVKRRKSPLEFSWLHITGTQDVWNLEKWLRENGLSQEYCGLVRLPNGVELYALFYDWGADKKVSQEIFERFRPGERLEGRKVIGYRGILGNPEDTQLRLSSIPKEESTHPLCSFQYNVSAFSAHCRQYREYWEWVKNRNPVRYQENKGHSYDAKNCSHCIRLLRMASEIARGDGMILDRREAGDRDFLLGVKQHKYSFDEVMGFIREAEEKMTEEFQRSSLPESPDLEALEDILIDIRKKHWGSLITL